MPDSPVAKIESDIRGFVRASYPDMVVHVEHWKEDPSRIALFFIDEHFEGLYPRQRYHYLVHLIPKDYCDSFLADTVWFELSNNANKTGNFQQWFRIALAESLRNHRSWRAYGRS